MTKTIHVYPSDAAWTVYRDGNISVYRNKRNAVGAAKQTARGMGSAQVVVHGKDGQIVQYVTYGLPRVQTPPNKGRFADPVQAAALRKALFDISNPPRNGATQG